MSESGTRREILQAGCLALFAGLVMALSPPVFPLILPDSAGYLRFAPERSSIYPVFLNAVESSGLGPESVPIVQITIFTGALFLLLRTLLRVVRSRMVVALFVLGLVANLPFNSLHHTILTESLYLSVIVVAAGQLIEFFRGGSTARLAAFAFFIGLSAGVRPAGVALLGLLPFILWAATTRFGGFRWPWLASIFIAVVLANGIEVGLYRWHHEGSRRSVLPIILFGKGAMIQQDDFTFHGEQSQPLAELSRAVDEKFGPAIAFLDSVPFFWLKAKLAGSYEGFAQYHLLRDEMRALSESASVDDEFLMAELGKARLRQAPQQWLKWTAYNYAAIWGIYAAQFPPFVPAYNEWLNAQESIPYRDSIERIAKPIPSSGAAIVVFPVMLFLCLFLGFLAATFSLRLLRGRHLPTTLLLAGIFSLGVHGSLLFSAAVNYSGARYALAAYPLMGLGAVFGGLFLLERIIHRELTSPDPDPERGAPGA